MDFLDLHRRFYAMLMDSQYWSVERMQEHQRSQLTQLLRHARQNTAFYESRLDGVLRPDGEIDWDRWLEIPLLTRADLRTHRHPMTAREIPAGHGATEVSKSSGSTGQPIETTQTELAAMAGSSATARSYRWHGIDVSQTNVVVHGDNPDKAAYPDGSLTEPWGPPVLHAGTKPGKFHGLNLAARPEQSLEFIMRHRPVYLGGLVTRVALLAHEAMRLGLKIDIDAVMPFGEAVTPAHRRIFRDAFGARAIPVYATQETHRIAHACPDHDHYHINAEMMLVEVLDDSGMPAEPGVPGRVVITPFYSTAQPLVRYEVGDIAALGGTTCSCGRTLPVLSDIVGRIAHMFRLPGGRRVLPNISDGDVVDLGARIWQLAQIGPNQLEFRYVPGERQGDEALFAERVKRQLHPEFDIGFVRLDWSHFEGRRKYIPYVCELPDLS